MDANVAPPILWRADRREDADAPATADSGTVAVAAAMSDASDGSDELVEDTDAGTILGGKYKGDDGDGEKGAASVTAAARDTMVRFFILQNVDVGSAWTAWMEWRNGDSPDLIYLSPVNQEPPINPSVGASIRPFLSIRPRAPFVSVTWAPDRKLSHRFYCFSAFD